MNSRSAPTDLPDPSGPSDPADPAGENGTFATVKATDVSWEDVRRLTMVLFLQHTGELVLVRERDRLIVPSGPVRGGESAYLDTALRLPLEIAGFRMQNKYTLGARGDHVAVWSEGHRYAGDRPHRIDAEWWTGDAAHGAAALRAQGDQSVAKLVELANAARLSLSDEQFFDETVHLLETAYLDERNTNPMQGSGFGGTEEAWHAGRAHLCGAVTRPGSFLDVGCANGYLLECLVQWSGERGVALDPFGVDLSARMVDDARRRLPRWAHHFMSGNSLDWVDPDGRRFDYVHTLLEIVPAPRHHELIDHLLSEVVAPGGRLILSHYVPVVEQDQWPRAIVEALGYEVAGETRPKAVPRLRVPPSVWITKR